MKKLLINPWFSILIKPKETIKKIVEYNVNHRLFILSFIIGFFTFLELGKQFYVSDIWPFPIFVLVFLILAPIFGYIFLTINSFFVYISGKLLKGKGKIKEIRAAIAWANVPIILNCIIWIVLIFLFGKILFSKKADSFLGNANFFDMSIIVYFVSSFLLMISSIWSFVIYINSLAAVQNFSCFKSIVNIVLSGIFTFLVIFAVIFIVMALTKWTCSHFFDEPKVVFFNNFLKY